MPLTGTSIPASTSIDSLFGTLFPNRSADLAATPSYSWADENGTLIGRWPNQPNYPAMYARFEARPNAPSVLNASGRGGSMSVQDSITAISSASFVIPAVGASVPISAVASWVDGGDTVSVNDGAGHQFKGTVVGNSGSVLTVLNSGYGGSSAPGVTVGSNAPVSLCGAPQQASDAIYVFDDFVTQSFASGGGPGILWTISGSAGYGAGAGDHYGILTFPALGNSISANLGGNTSIPFTLLAKAVVRFVVAPTTAPVLATGTNEWYCGFQEVGGQNYGALFSNAQGYGNATLPADGGVGFVDATTGLVAGTYNNVATNNYGYKQTLVQPALNQWLDLIIAWTPTACRFYAGPYGVPPPLKATITNNLVNSPTPMIRALFASNMQSGAVVSVDRIEYMLQPSSGAPRFLGGRMLGF
jgi:hypothetical protein